MYDVLWVHVLEGDDALTERYTSRSQGNKALILITLKYMHSQNVIHLDLKVTML